MSSGREHTHYNLLATLAIFAACIPWSTHSGIVVFLIPVGALINTYLLSPDLDLVKSDPLKNWGILGFIWLPFAWVVPHRSIFSHWPGIGTATKDLYLFGIAVFFWVIAGTLIQQNSIYEIWFWKNIIFEFVTRHPVGLAYLFAGQCLGDGLHLVFDTESTYKKHVTRRLIFNRGRK